MKQFQFFLACCITGLTYCNGVLSAPLATTYTSEMHPHDGSVQNSLLLQDMEMINLQIDYMKRVHNADSDPEILQVLKAVFGDDLNLGEVQSMVNILSDGKATVPVANVTDFPVDCSGAGTSKGASIQAIWDQSALLGHATALQIADSFYEAFPDVQALAVLSYATMALEGMGTRNYWKLDSAHQKLIPVPLEELLNAQDSEKSQFVNGNLAHDYLAVYSWAQPDLLHKNAANWGVLGYVLTNQHFPERLRILDQKLPATFLRSVPPY